MTSQVIVKIDKKLKDQAMQKAQNSGVAFSNVIKLDIDSNSRFFNYLSKS